MTNFYHVRIENPNSIEKYKTMELTGNIKIVVGKLKKGGDGKSFNDSLGDMINGVLDSPIVKLVGTFLPFML